MQRIYRGDLEKVTKVKLLDRGAPPSLRPRLLAIRPSERSAVNVKIPQGKMFCQCLRLTAGLETQASAAAFNYSAQTRLCWFHYVQQRTKIPKQNSISSLECWKMTRPLKVSGLRMMGGESASTQDDS